MSFLMWPNLKSKLRLKSNAAEMSAWLFSFIAVVDVTCRRRCRCSGGRNTVVDDDDACTALSLVLEYWFEVDDASSLLASLQLKAALVLATCSRDNC